MKLRRDKDQAVALREYAVVQERGNTRTTTVAVEAGGGIVYMRDSRDIHVCNTPDPLRFGVDSIFVCDTCQSKYVLIYDEYNYREWMLLQWYNPLAWTHYRRLHKMRKVKK